MEAPVHDFQERLAYSHAQEEAAWWEDVYRAAFPSLAAMVSVRADGWAQRAGIDRILTLNNGKVIKIDEKVRSRDFPDFALERWSNEANKKPGWTQKPLDCDFIAYAFVATGMCYLLPILLLQKASRELAEHGLIHIQK